eukprot:3135190-Rhodomonas_salina.5
MCGIEREEGDANPRSRCRSMTKFESAQAVSGPGIAEHAHRPIPYLTCRQLSPSRASKVQCRGVRERAASTCALVSTRHRTACASLWLPADLEDVDVLQLCALH